MDKNYLECIEHIIEIEKNCHTQEKLIDSIEKKIKTLAVAKKINIPQKINTYVPPVNYNLVTATKLDSETIKSISFGCAIVFGLLGMIIGYNSGSIWGGIIWGIIIGAVGGAVFGFAKNASSETEAEETNKKSQQEAQKEADRLFNEQAYKDEQKYQNDLKKYNALVLFDKNRVDLENKQKEELLCTIKELIHKHEETKKLLTRFYDFADIYEIYRNIVAMCHIYEYLKSGVCNQLIGRDGAYLIFKYEMYEKLKIERLDTIVSKLEQLHFDNVTLNKTMEEISSKCDNLIGEIGDLKAVQIETAQRNETLLNNLGNRIDSAAECIAYQNSVIAYNQECTISELNQIKWLSVMERI